MSEQDFGLPKQMQEILAELAAVRNELSSLKEKTAALPLPVDHTTSSSSTITNTRRKTLKRLGMALLGGAAAATLTGFSVSEAKMIVNPSTTSGYVGTIIVPPGKSVPLNSPIKYIGLVSTDGSAMDLANLPEDTGASSTGLLGFSGAQTGHGVLGLSNNSYSYGVFGNASALNSYGVYGKATNVNSYGVYGIATSSTSYGVYGFATGTGSYAGYFFGDVHLTGTLTGGTKQFKIDHPLDPANKYLYHTSVESPDMKNIYDGVVTLDEQGTATITMPDWFEALNSDFRYQLTSLGQASPNLHVADEIQGHNFRIAGGFAGQKVSWMVTGIRQDAYAKAHRSPVEMDKPGDEKGKYIHPELFGQPEEMSVSPGPKISK